MIDWKECRRKGLWSNFRNTSQELREKKFLSRSPVSNPRFEPIPPDYKSRVYVYPVPPDLSLFSLSPLT